MARVKIECVCVGGGGEISPVRIVCVMEGEGGGGRRPVMKGEGKGLLKYLD